MNTRKTYSQICTLLALPLADPAVWRRQAPGRWAALLQASLDGAGLERLDSAGPGLAVSDRLKEWPSAHAERDYCQAFLPPGRPVHPVESVFKLWTTQTGAAVPMARQKGWLGGDSAAHLRALYTALGVKVPGEYAHAPDHLALELEFLGVLAEEMREMAELFRRQHLDWLGELVTVGRDLEVPGFYQDLFALIADFVSREVPAQPRLHLHA